MRILLVSNDGLLNAKLTKVLSANRYILDKALDGQAGLNLVTDVEYDLILLDVHLPSLDGISLCRKLRSIGYLKPILFMTDNENDADVVALFDAGADDYICKPFAPEILVAKIRTLLRRSGAIVPNASALNPTTLRWGKLCLNPNSGLVTVDETVVALTTKEYNLLELFLRNPNRIFNRSAILDKLWGFDDAPTDRAIITHIKDLRKKLKASGLVEDLLETIYGMGYRLKPAPNSNLSENNQVSTQPNLCAKSTINRVLEKFRDTFNQQVAVLSQVKNALLVGQAIDLSAAKLEAHKLAGSLETFGYPDGSKQARALEHLLMKDSPFTPLEIERYCELVTALQQTLAIGPVIQAASPLSTTIYQVLAIDDDVALTERLKAESLAWGVQMTVVSNITDARTFLKKAPPDLVLLDLSFPDAHNNGLSLLPEIKEKTPNLPVIIFTGRDSLTDRLAVSRLGARQFLNKPATPEQIFRAITQVLSASVTSSAKVLIVDDDVAALALLSSILTPWGLDVVTLSEPQHFWEVLVLASPNLVLLDLEMPNYSGLELCQVVRQDSQWGNLPILVVTAHTDADSLVGAFAAGADDFITKPVLGPELVTRVLSRIERTRLR